MPDAYIQDVFLQKILDFLQFFVTQGFTFLKPSAYIESQSGFIVGSSWTFLPVLADLNLFYLLPDPYKLTLMYGQIALQIKQEQQAQKPKAEATNIS